MCVYVCMYVCVCMYVYVFVCVSCTCICVCVCKLYVYIYVCVCVNLWLFVCVRVCVYASVYMWCVYVRACVFLACVCMCGYVFVVCACVSGTRNPQNVCSSTELVCICSSVCLWIHVLCIRDTYYLCAHAYEHTLILLHTRAHTTLTHNTRHTHTQTLHKTRTHTYPHAYTVTSTQKTPSYRYKYHQWRIPSVISLYREWASGGPHIIKPMVSSHKPFLRSDKKLFRPCFIMCGRKVSEKDQREREIFVWERE